MKRSYFHQLGETPLLGDTIPDHFTKVVASAGDREAVVSCHQNIRYSYIELAAEIDGAAKALLAAGFARGDRVGVWSTDNVEWLVLQMATARVGVVLVNINPAYRPRELLYALKKSGVQGLFLIPAFRTSNYVEMLVDTVPELKKSTQKSLKSKALPLLRRVIIWDPADARATVSPWSGIQAWPDFLAAGAGVSQARLDAANAELDSDDAINIQYTSGTTGFPKAVVLSHHNILNNAWFVARAMHFDTADRLCVPVPFYHCFGMVLSNLLCFSVGACLVIPSEHFDPLAVLQAIATERCTAVHGVPTMFIAQLDHPDFADFDLTSLRTGIMAGAPCPPELMRRVMQDMHCTEILIAYGQTEASPVTHLTTRDDTIERRTETVGCSLPHQEAKVADPESGHTLPAGEIGEICFRGYHVMKGYYDNEEATRETIDDARWLHSGDLGTMDTDGYVRITGRLKEMIIRGGENIYPAEIEAWLFSHPDIAQAAVFGIPDARLGEDIACWIQCHEGHTLSEDDIRSYCREGLAHFKVPGNIRFVDDFPMTVTGKVQKFKMREIMAADDPS